MATMKSHLTHRILRQLRYAALYQDLRCPPICYSRWCLHLSPSLAPVSASSAAHQRRNLFNFLKRSSPKQTTTKHEPGYEVLLELSDKLQKRVRPPPADEVQTAFRTFVQFKKGAGRLEDVQMEHVKTAYEYLQSEVTHEDWSQELSGKDIRDLLFVLTKYTPAFVRFQPAIELTRLLFEDSRSRYKAIDKEAMNEDGQKLYHIALMTYIKILSFNGEALDAKRLTEEFCAEDEAKAKANSMACDVVRGLVQEMRDPEVAQFVSNLEAHDVAMDSKIQTYIVSEYAASRKDIDKAKHWYQYSLPNGQIPTAKTRRSLLGLCITSRYLEFGDEIVKDILKYDASDKYALDLTLRWASFKGKGVEEIERMMEIIKGKHPDQPQLHPNMTTINGLAQLAINKSNDPYIAERYFALGQKLGFEPNADTHLLQLVYRIEKEDLSGAMTSYSSLRNFEPSEKHFDILNRLIVAFCEERSHNYDAIMSLVDDLSEQKARFLPGTVAALARLHLQRSEMDDLRDLLNTYTGSFGTLDRELVRAVLVDHVISQKTGQVQAWDTWNITRAVFPELPLSVRIDVMKSFFDRERPDMGTHAFGQMRHSQLKEQRPTVEAYAACLEGIGKYADSENLEAVHNMFKLDTEVEPNTKIYNALMLAYTGCFDGNRALHIWEDIFHSQEGPTYSSIQIALRACEWTPQGEKEANKIWKRIKGSEMEITRGVYAAYLGALAAHGYFDECVALCSDAEKLDFGIDALLLGTFFNASRNEEKRQRFKEWARETYPEAYESLLECGQCEIKRGQSGVESFGRTYEGPADGTRYFNIGHLGRDAKP